MIYNVLFQFGEREIVEYRTALLHGGEFPPHGNDVGYKPPFALGKRFGAVVNYGGKCKRGVKLFGFELGRAVEISGGADLFFQPACDGAVRIVGDSMSPVLRSGDLVLYRQLADPSEIFWGEMYLVAVEHSAGEYIAVRYIRKSENKGMALLAGENPEFADTEVELSKITALAFVKATIRLNSVK